MVDAMCPVCGKVYNIPEGRGRAMVETHFLRHKDGCCVPDPGEVVRVRNSLAIVDDVDEASDDFPLLTVRYPSGRASVLRASVVDRVPDQDAAREQFFA